MTLLRPAIDADAPALGDILQDWIETTPWMPVLHSRAGTQSFLGRLIRETRVTVAVSSSAVPLGFLARDGSDIPALYLAADARGQGIGSALLEVAQAESSSLELWVFQANAGARRFYARHGFRELRRTDGSGNDEKLPDIRLEWSRG
jgi:GNAT superfamily N-acetyltransferase